MRQGLAIGSILGVRVRVHPSWFIVFALVTLSIVAVSIPGREDLPLGLRWLMGAAVAGLFFASVLVHEMAHALVARRRGMAVDEITLFIFGGPPGLDQEVPDARSEALIAGVGPVVSLAVAGAALGLWLVTADATGEVAVLVSGAAWWIAMSNLLLGAFNVVPGFPMDGGRFLRAVLWARTRDFVRATRMASLVGRVLAYGLIIGGLAWALSGEVVLGIWLAFIGWFLNQAAEASYRRVEFSRLVMGISVGDVMDRDVAVIGPNLTLDTLVDQHLLGGRAGFYPVIMDGALVGTVEMGQVRRVPRSDWPVTRVTDVMTRGEQMQTLREPASVMEAMTRMEESGASAIAVIDEDERRQFLGLVTRDGLVRALRRRAVLRPQGSGGRP